MNTNAHNETTCPRCQLEVTQERLNAIPAVCGSCGYILSSHNSQTKLEKNAERWNMRIVVGASAALLVGFMHLASWGSHAIEVRWLQARDLIGFATVANMERMAAICEELKKPRCVEYTFRRQAQIDITRSSQLAQYLIDRKKFTEAAESLKPYVYAKAKTPDFLALGLYAQALGQSGHIDEATHFYERIMTSRQKDARSMKKTMLQNYVRDLARAKRHSQAQAVIIRMRRALRAPRLMAQEMRILTALTTNRQTASK